MSKPTLVLGKKIVSRTEVVQDYVDKVGHTNAVIGISARYAFYAWLIKLLGIRKKFIYYCIDFYIPEIATGWLDRIFIWLHTHMDRFLALRADELWDISHQINRGRCGYHMPSTIVPLGYPPHYFRNVTMNPKIRKQLIYVGLNPYGMELVREVGNEMRNDIQLVLLINRRLPLDELLKRVSRAGIGVALWNREGNQTYGDSGKIKLYLICGLPVIVTRNANFADVIDREGAGIAIDYNKYQLKKAIEVILDNYDTYKQNALRVAREYCNSHKIFEQAGVLNDIT